MQFLSNAHTISYKSTSIFEHTKKLQIHMYTVPITILSFFQIHMQFLPNIQTTFYVQLLTNQNFASDKSIPMQLPTITIEIFFTHIPAHSNRSICSFRLIDMQLLITKQTTYDKSTCCF